MFCQLDKIPYKSSPLLLSNQGSNFEKPAFEGTFRS